MRSVRLFFTAASLAAIFLVSAPATAKSLVLHPPVNIEAAPGSEILGYFDVDPSPERRDYHGGMLSYDGHTGTDIYVPWNITFSEDGMPVLAAAAGVVRAVRDGEPDVNVNHLGEEAVKGREAGNGVVIDHGDGWVTQYSHLRNSSVQVKPGEQVVVGQVLGLVGMSGSTEYPHVEMEVRYNDKPVCPFLGKAVHDGSEAQPLWSAEAQELMPYVSGGVLSSGFCDRVPTLEGLKRGECAMISLPRASKVLVFWALAFGVQAGDIFDQVVTSPDGGALVKDQATLERTQTLHMRYVGKTLGASGWAAGEYVGAIRLLRNGNTYDETVRRLVVY